MKRRALNIINMNTNNSTLKNRTDVISIIVPSLNRYEWLEKLVISLHKHADYPFELIINDDGSFDGTTKLIQERLFDKITLLIHNCRKGKNQGLCTSINRMISCVTSNYIVMLNADMEIQRPFFKDTINILNKEYVGFTTLLNSFHREEDVSVYLESNGTKFTLQESFGQGSAIAYRKNVFEEIGGLADVNCLTSDGHFMFNIWKHGYFNGKFLIDHISNPIMIDNSSLHTENKDSTLGNKDGNFPKYFNVTDEELTHADNNRSNFIVKNANDFEYGSADIDHHCNTPFWQQYMSKLLYGKVLSENGIDWELSKKYGQNRFNEKIERDTIFK